MNKRPLILVIDDDEENQTYTVDALKHCGYSATGTSTPAAALELIRRLPSLQLVLCDIELGPMRGPALIRQALRHRPDLKVVFMTGGSTEVEEVRHSDPILAKPFQLQDLCATIEAVLKAQPRSERQQGTAERRRRVAM
jgi:two-component system cell cycle sensor histidine kinase/response regulator CckA